MPTYQTRILLDYFVWWDRMVFAIRKVLSATREKVISLDCRNAGAGVVRAMAAPGKTIAPGTTATFSAGHGH
jgi:hypothetical protein